MLEEVHVIVCEKNGVIPFQLWTVALETYFAESAKKLWTTVFCISKSIVISAASTNGI